MLKWYWLFLALILLAMPAMAVNPTVVETWPPNGAQQVSPGERKIVITFSQPMKMNSWSFVESGLGVFPQILANPEFRGPTTCVLRVQLEPGVTYSLGLNSPTRSGFKLAADESVPLQPYVLTFSVATSQPGVTLDTTNGPAQDTTPPSQPVPIPRPSSPPMSQPEPAPRGGGDPGLSGVWLFRDVEEEVVVQIKPDGSYYVRTQSSDGMEENQGSYTVHEGVLHTRSEYGEILKYPYQLLGQGTLQLDLSDEGIPAYLQLLRVETVPDPREWQPQDGGWGEDSPGMSQPDGPQPWSQGHGGQDHVPWGQTLGTDPQWPAEQLPDRLNERSSPGSQSRMPHAPTRSKPVEQLLLRRYTDRTENAFTILVPDGWLTSGGILRVNPLETSGPAQSIAAKLDFTVASDQQGTVMLRWVPSDYSIDMRHMPAAPLFPQGASYMGMSVHPVMAPLDFNRMVFQNLRRGAQDVRIEEQRDLPRLAGLFDQALVQMGTAQYGIRNAAGLVSLVYQEDGRAYREKIVTVIEDMGQVAAGMWSNKLTIAVRAPVEEFEAWAPVLWLIANSSTINPQWVEGELRGQRQRGEILIDVQRQVQDIGRAITEHRQKTNAEIMNDMHLNLMGQEEYVNPFTNEVEIGTNQYHYRWVNNLGDVLYTDQETYDPNIDPAMHAANFKRSMARPR